MTTETMLDTAAAPVMSRVSVPLTVRTLTASKRAEALAQWQILEQRTAADRPVAITASHSWVSAWLQHYGDVVPHEFLLGTAAGEPVGITLVTRGVGRKNGPFPMRTRHLGTAGERPGQSVCVEYNRLPVLAAYRDRFEHAVIAHVLQDKEWDAFCLDGFAEDDLHRLLQDIPGADLHERESPWHDLRTTREQGVEVLDRLGRSTRQNTRRLLRKYGELELQWADDPATAGNILDELISLHQARWQAAGQPGAFHSPRFAGFQHTLVHAAYADPESHRTAQLVRVRHQGDTVGCLLLLVDGPRLLDYLSGFADFEKHPSPGIITHVLAMQAALSRGYDAYDFLVGEKRHKQNLSTDVAKLVWATWTRRTLKSRTIDTLRSLKRRWRSFRANPLATQPAAVLT